MSCFQSRRREAVLPRSLKSHLSWQEFTQQWKGESMLCGLNIKTAMAEMIKDPRRNNQNRETCQLVHNCRRKDYKLQHRFPESVTEVLNWWLVTPLEWHFRYLAYQNFTLRFIAVKKLQFWSNNEINVRLGATITWETVLNSCSVRKVENHWFRRICPGGERGVGGEEKEKI